MKGQGRRICALRPSRGLGGGIEAYIAAVLEALDREDVIIEECSLRVPERPYSLGRRIGFVIETFRAARRLRGSVDSQILVFHPNFSVLGLLLRSIGGSPKPKLRVVGHGVDVWAAGRWTRRAWRRADLDLVAVSSFTGGAFAPLPVRLLPPGIPSSRYQALLASERPSPELGEPLRILSVFRLGDARIKGAEVLLEAAQDLVSRRRNVQVTFAGHGPAPAWLERAAESCDWLEVVPSPSTDELIRLYARANVFVLATLMLPNSGEGFGIVLAEAQLAGCVVLAPPLDGSSDAIVPGVTGLRPIDSSASALRDTLLWCLDEPHAAARIASNARVWSSSRFSPDRYREEVAAVLLDGPSPQDLSISVARANGEHPSKRPPERG